MPCHTSKLSSWDKRFCDMDSRCYLHSTHWTCVIILSFGCCKPTLATASSRRAYQIWKWSHLHFALVLWVMHTALLISSPLSQLFLFSKLPTRCQRWSLGGQEMVLHVCVLWSFPMKPQCSACAASSNPDWIRPRFFCGLNTSIPP